jgi:hypothetical protein
MVYIIYVKQHLSRFQLIYIPHLNDIINQLKDV